MGRSRRPTKKRAESGIALFMVTAAIAVLAILVAEFSRVAIVNESMAFDSLDQVRAYYLAKSGLKLSLLRLKAYQQVKTLLASMGSSAGAAGQAAVSAAVPKSIVEKIWNFPFAYPLPTDIPGMTDNDKTQIKKFQDASSLQGSFMAIIESESSRYNLNMILPQFAPSGTPSSPPAGTSTPGQTSPPQGAATPSPSPSPFNVEEARQSLSDYLSQLLNNKYQADTAFADAHSDFRMDDFMDTLLGWADRTYERRGSGAQDWVPMKRAPFYTVAELHMLPPMDDELYQVLAPGLTVSTTVGVNINTMNSSMLQALVPQMTADEVAAFMKFRESTDQDNFFKTADDFFNYLKDNVAAFKSNPTLVTDLQSDLQKRNLRLVTDETDFRVTVTAHAGSSTRMIQAWVQLGAATPTAQTAGTAPGQTPPPPVAPGGVQTAPTPPADPGVKITFMRIL